MILSKISYGEPIDNAIAERRLFQATIINAVRDAINPTSVASPSQKHLAMQQGESWFSLLDDDFRFVCEMAGYEAHSVRNAALAFIRRARIDGEFYAKFLKFARRV